MDQVGFKVCALLEGRQRRPLAKEYLFGDDAESDAAAFYLYASLIHERLPVQEAADRMAGTGMREDNQRRALALLARLPEKRGKVKKVFIHLEKRRPPEQFEPFARLVTPVRDGLQLGLALFALGLVDADTVRQCRQAISIGTREPDADLEALIKDAIHRRSISRKKLRLLDSVLPTPSPRKS